MKKIQIHTLEVISDIVDYINNKITKENILLVYILPQENAEEVQFQQNIPYEKG